jgi:hypothetical protein
MGPDGSVGGDVDDPKPRASRLSIASLVLGIASVASPVLQAISITGVLGLFEGIDLVRFVLLFGGFVGLFAVLFGHVSRRKVGGRPGLKSAASLVGLTLGYIGLVFFLVILFVSLYLEAL